jgi:hypothetical protein
MLQWKNIHCSYIRQLNSPFFSVSYRFKMNSWLFLCFILPYAETISIGLIRNVSLTLLTPSFSSTMNGTSQTCRCAMMMSSNISAFNYYLNNTCQLFSSASLTNTYFSWESNTNSMFYFLQLPTEAATTAQDTTAVTVSTLNLQ